MVTPLVVPQVNVNDETVKLVRWRVTDNSKIAEGDLVCEVETTKAVAEVYAPASGILRQIVPVGVHVRVGEPIGAIGPTSEAVAAYLTATPAVKASPAAGISATPKARALAGQKGISLEAVMRSGVQGTIKESDVRKFAGESPSAPSSLPAGLMKYVEREGPLPPFDAAVAANLRRSTDHLILTSIDMNCRLASAHAATQRAHAAGRMVSVLHLTIAAVARVLPKFPRLMSVVHEGTLYRYRAIDVAFISRTSDGRLFTPVIRSADRLSLEEIANASQAATLQLMRGSVKADDLEGAAFTITQVPVPGTTRVAALPSFGQSAILGLSAERQALELVDGAVVERPAMTLTLSYDHALCDGVYAANFLAALVSDLERPIS
jgi:pyruvate dehydrogenase E2 component (dihydrolipoamide acetyltransferase)